MKIAFVGNLPASSVLPGDAIRSRNRGPEHPSPWMTALLPALAELERFQLRVFLVQHAIKKRILVERDGVEYEGVPYPFPERLNLRTLFIGRSRWLKGPLREFGPDVVHSFGMETGAATMALRSGYPVSCFVQGIAEKLYPFHVGRPWPDPWLESFCERRAVKRVRWFVAETEFAKEWVTSRSPGAHVALIPHPLRQEFLDRGAPTFGKQIISVGYFYHLKGMDTVIRAFARLGDDEARLCMVGAGPALDGLRQLTVELGVEARVEFTGALSTDRVIDCMNQSCAFAIGSRMDTSPNVISEAHAVGLPVIGTRAGGIPEMIEDGVDGYHVDVDDDLDMSKKMDLCLSNPDRAREMGVSGRAKVKNLNSPAKIASAHADLFDKAFRDLRAEGAK